jgi:hypothetical protein
MLEPNDEDIASSTNCFLGLHATIILRDANNKNHRKKLDEKITPIWHNTSTKIMNEESFSYVEV